MADVKGLYGLTVQGKELGSPIAGFFGFSVQMGINFAISGTDEAGRELSRCTLEIAYTQNSVLTKEVIQYDPRILYQRSLPTGVPVTVRMYGPGYLLYSGTFTLATGEYRTLPIVMKFAYAIGKRYSIKN